MAGNMETEFLIEKMRLMQMELNVLRADQRSGYLTRHGLPALGDKTVSDSGPGYGTHRSWGKPVKQRFNSEFGILTEYQLEKLPLKFISTIWKLSEDDSLPNYSSETDVQNYVNMVIRDIIQLSGLKAELQSNLEVTLSLLEHLRPDILIFRVRGTIVGCAEVKKPASGGGIDFTNPNLKNQVANYLRQLRELYGIDAPIAIVTSYDQWQVWYLDESCDLAHAVNLAEYVRKCAQKSNHASTHDVIHCTRTYSYNDPSLVELLVSVIIKMNATTSHPPVKYARMLAEECRKYGKATIEDSSFVFEVLPLQLVLSYTPAAANTKVFYFLKDYHGGRDGRVWMVTSAQGCLGVIKLSKDRSYREEAAHWAHIWGATSARTFEIFGARALLMPFAFRCVPSNTCADPTFELLHSAASDHGSDDRALLTALQSETGCEFGGCEIDYFRRPLLAAKIALKRMAEKGYVHEDLGWRHLALMPIYCSGRWTVTPVLLDLQGVRQLHCDESVASVVAAGLRLLAEERIQRGGHRTQPRNPEPTLSPPALQPETELPSLVMASPKQMQEQNPLHHSRQPPQKTTVTSQLQNAIAKRVTFSDAAREKSAQFMTRSSSSGDGTSAPVAASTTVVGAPLASSRVSSRLQKASGESVVISDAASEKSAQFMMHSSSGDGTSAPVARVDKAPLKLRLYQNLLNAVEDLAAAFEATTLQDVPFAKSQRPPVLRDNANATDGAFGMKLRSAKQKWNI